MIVSVLVVAAAILILWGAAYVITQRHNSKTASPKSGTITLGKAASMAKQVDHNGPVPLADTSGHGRTVYIQHVGADPNAGWFAFYAGVEGVDDPNCVWNWQQHAGHFVASCNANRTLPPDAPGVEHLPVTIDKGKLQLQLP